MPSSCHGLKNVTFAGNMVACLSPLILLVFAPFCVQADDLKTDSRDGVIKIQRNGKPWLQYFSDPHPSRGYISHWYSPAGVQILRDSPHDHVHHHALMYAVAIDGVDFWSEEPQKDYGQQMVRSSRTSGQTTDGRATATIQETVDWIAPDGKTLAIENREIKAQMGLVPGASLLTWQLTMRPSAGKQTVELGGSHYFGLGLRFVESMDKDGIFMFPSGSIGEGVRGSEKLTPAAWCAYQAQVDGQPVTVAMFDAPQNPRHPATWFTMTDPFAYLSATMNLSKERLKISREQPLRARYGIALWDGHRTASEIEAAHSLWLNR